VRFEEKHAESFKEEITDFYRFDDTATEAKHDTIDENNAAKFSYL